MARSPARTRSLPNVAAQYADHDAARDTTGRSGPARQQDAPCESLDGGRTQRTRVAHSGRLDPPPASISRGRPPAPPARVAPLGHEAAHRIQWTRTPSTTPSGVSKILHAMRPASRSRCGRTMRSLPQRPKGDEDDESEEMTFAGATASSSGRARIQRIERQKRSVEKPERLGRSSSDRAIARPAAGCARPTVRGIAIPRARQADVSITRRGGRRASAASAAMTPEPPGKGEIAAAPCRWPGARMKHHATSCERISINPVGRGPGNSRSPASRNARPRSAPISPRPC